MNPAGRMPSRSSSVPTRTTITSVRALECANMCVPHCGQKRRRTMLPLSAVLRYSAVCPVICIPSVRKMALTDALPAARYWQSRHQHARTATGAAEDSYRTAPQKHRPVIADIKFSYPPGRSSSPRVLAHFSVLDTCFDERICPDLVTRLRRVHLIRHQRCRNRLVLSQKLFVHIQHLDHGIALKALLQ